MMRTGGPSRSTSLTRAAGIQYCRISSPIGVPGPVRVIRSNWSDMIALLPAALTPRLDALGDGGRALLHQLLHFLAMELQPIARLGRRVVAAADMGEQ